MPLTGPPTIDSGLEAEVDPGLVFSAIALSMAANLTIVTVDTRAPAALPAESSGSSTSNAMERCLPRLTGELCLLVLNRELLAVIVRELLPVSTGELLLV